MSCLPVFLRLCTISRTSRVQKRLPAEDQMVDPVVDVVVVAEDTVPIYKYLVFDERLTSW